MRIDNMPRQFLLLLLLFPIDSFAVSAFSLYCGASCSVNLVSGNKFLYKDSSNFLTNKSASAFVGAGVMSLRFEGSAEYFPDLGVSINETQFKAKMVNYSFSTTYDFLLPLVHPYIGLRYGYARLNQDNVLLDSNYVGGILGLDFMLTDFLAIGVNYNIDYMSFLKKKIDTKDDKVPIFHNIGIRIKCGI
jgi:hypothetical protein